MEQQYLKLLRRLLESPVRETRNGPVHSYFSYHITHDMYGGFPLLTTKKMFWKGVIEELSWFLRGCTDVQQLRDKGVHIWDGNTKDRDWDAGPIYGWQWRHWGAEYKDKDTDYTGQGNDQIARVLHLLKNDPNSRRIILHGWNVSDLNDMALPPCHVMYQFYVESDGRVSVQMTQRSADVFLGLPFNIASTALLLTVIAQEVGRAPGYLHINIGDAHLYACHEEQARMQISRVPRALPLLEIEREPDGCWDLKSSQCTIKEYDPHPRIKAAMIA